MVDFSAARRMMVEGQVRTADVTDLRLLAALQEVPRERFVSERSACLAYLDRDLPLAEWASGGGERFLIKPMVLAKMIQLAEISETDRVLDVGCATGYSSAVLARLAGSVVALEEDAALARQAEAMMAAQGVANVEVAVGALVAGWPAMEPYDAILLQGGTEIVPESLFGQLKDGGRLVCAQGTAPLRKVMIYRSVEGEVSGRPAFDAAAPLLPGFAKRPAFVF